MGTDAINARVTEDNMQINISIDAENLKARTAKEAKNLAYSTAQAINDTAKDVQYRIQGDVQQLFRIRKKPGAKSWADASSEFSDATGDQPSRSERSFIIRQIKIFAWANVMKGKIFAEIGINNRPRLLLSHFEQGGMREPFKGKRVAVPITKTARGGSIQNPVNPNLTFRKLGFKKTRTASGKRQIKGKLRTFILQKTDRHPQGGVYQRIGPGRKDIRMVYSFRRSFRLRAVLGFVKKAQETYIRNFRENFYRRLLHLKR
jgi:hypothetical protein